MTKYSHPSWKFLASTLPANILEECLGSDARPIPLTIQRKLASDPRTKVRSALASRPQIDPEIRQKLAQDPHRRVRNGLFFCKEDPPEQLALEILEREFSEPSKSTLDVLDAASSVKSIKTESLLHYLGKAIKIFPQATMMLLGIVFTISDREELTAEQWWALAKVLKKLGKDAEPILDSPGIPKEVRQKTLESGSKKERARLLSNPGLSDSERIRLLDSGIVGVMSGFIGDELLEQVLKRPYSVKIKEELFLRIRPEGNQLEKILDALGEKGAMLIRDAPISLELAQKMLDGAWGSRVRTSMLRFGEMSAEVQNYVFEKCEGDINFLSRMSHAHLLGEAELEKVVTTTGYAYHQSEIPLKWFYEKMPLRELQTLAKNYGVPYALLQSVRDGCPRDLFEALSLNWVGTLKELEAACKAL